jgi:hypothetical protein
MEQGARSLLIILGVALVAGAIVIAAHPAYRQAFFSILNGTPAESPIWQSNAEYYPDIALDSSSPAPAAPESPAL